MEVKKIMIVIMFSFIFVSLSSATAFGLSQGDHTEYTISTNENWAEGLFDYTERDADTICLLEGWDTVWSDSNKYTATWDEGWEKGAIAEDISVVGVDNLQITYEYRAVKTDDGISISPKSHGKFEVEDEEHDNIIGHTDTKTDSWQIKEFTYNTSNFAGAIDNLIFWLTGAGSGDSEKYKGQMKDHEIEKWVDAKEGTWTHSYNWGSYKVTVDNIETTTNQATDNTENIYIEVGGDDDGDGTVDFWSAKKQVDNGSNVITFGTSKMAITTVKIYLESDSTEHSPYFNSFTVNATVETIAPNKPTNLTPQGEVTSTDLTLTADVTHPAGGDMDVFFYNNRTGDLIGSDESVADGGTASIQWNDRTLTHGHSFYVISQNDGGDLESPKSDIATFYGENNKLFQVSVVNEEEFDDWSYDKIRDNLSFAFHGEDWSTRIEASGDNPENFFVPPDVEHVTSHYGTSYSRSLLTHGENSLTFVMNQNLGVLSSYIFNLEDPTGNWGPPEGEIQLYKYSGMGKYPVYDSRWSSQNLIEAPLWKGTEYRVRLTSREGNVLEYGTITAGTYGEKTIKPAVEQGENIYEGYLTENIKITGSFDNVNDNVEVSYKDNGGKTNSVDLRIIDENNNDIANETITTSPNDWSKSYSVAENQIVMVALQIHHDDLGDKWYMFGISTYTKRGLEETRPIPGVEETLGSWPVSFATFGSVMLLLFGLFAIAPKMAGIGCILTGVMAALLWWLGYFAIQPQIIVLILFIGFIVQAGERGGVFG